MLENSLVTENSFWRARRKKEENFGLDNVVSRLRETKKITPEFEAMLSYLSWEEIMALKLEQTMRFLHSTYIGIPLWRNLEYICKDALLKCVYSIAHSRVEAAGMLGISTAQLIKSFRKFKIQLPMAKAEGPIDQPTRSAGSSSR